MLWVALDDMTIIVGDEAVVIMPDPRGTVVTHHPRFIGLDHGIKIALGMDVELLLALEDLPCGSR